MLYDILDIVKDENLKKGLKSRCIKCPICGSEDWTLLGKSSNTQKHEEELKGRSHYFVKIMCESCGYTAEFDALKIAYREEEEI